MQNVLYDQPILASMAVGYVACQKLHEIKSALPSTSVEGKKKKRTSYAVHPNAQTSEARVTALA